MNKHTEIEYEEATIPQIPTEEKINIFANLVIDKILEDVTKKSLLQPVPKQ